MNIKYYAMALSFSSIILHGCTTSLYQGQLDVMDSNNQPRKAVIYWTKTDVFIGKDKAGPAVLMTECSTRRLTFVERGTGIYFFGTPGQDFFPNRQPIPTPNILCGKIIDELRFKNIEPGPVKVDIRCIAETSEFSVNEATAGSAYINARQEPYTFEITETSDWNLSGDSLPAPDVPACRK